MNWELLYEEGVAFISTIIWIKFDRWKLLQSVIDVHYVNYRGTDVRERVKHTWKQKPNVYTNKCYKKDRANIIRILMLY